MQYKDLPRYYQGQRRVFLVLGLDMMTEKEVLERYDHPRVLAEHSGAKGIPCSYPLAEAILFKAGWVPPPDYATDQLVGLRARSAASIAGGFMRIYKNFSVPLGHFLYVRYNDVTYIAEATAEGLFDQRTKKHYSPTGWARFVRGYEGTMAPAPRSFWPKVINVAPDRLAELLATMPPVNPFLYAREARARGFDCAPVVPTTEAD